MVINTKEAINDLSVKLTFAEKLDVSDLAGQMIAIGFECIRCGECCRARSGDNSVMVFPDEIRTILKTYGLKWDGICEPSMLRFIDDHGILHALEWELKKQDNGDCIFIKENNACRIYSQRPWICRTYPFYLILEDASSEPHLEISDCRGIGRALVKEDAVELALLLKHRLILEIQEEIQVLKHLEAFDGWKSIRCYSRDEMDAKPRFAVHDSSGVTYV